MNTVKTFKIGINSTRKLPRLTNVGYICPNGNINFQTNEAAVAYAKNYIIEALKCPKPFERAVLLSNNIILGKYDGTSKGVRVKKSDIRNAKKHLHNKNVSVYHGHPDNAKIGAAKPISIYDYISLMLSNHDEDVAINSKGEFSKLKKTHKPILLSSMKWFIRAIVQSCDNAYGKRVTSKYKYVITSPQSMPQYIHEFWKWAATKTKYGIEYSTNFSHLKNI